MNNPYFQAIEEVNTTSIDTIETMLENDIKNNKKERWNKLDKTIKYNKLIDFANVYEEDDSKREQLKNLLIDSLNDNKFSKISDVIYEDDKIVSIPSLILVDEKYYIRVQKRQLTSKSLSMKSSKTKRNKK
tara:strand:+ start:5044 stop:5436 length:393 start_codon:yes stop_codon:yes gene_type:complete